MDLTPNDFEKEFRARRGKVDELKKLLDKAQDAYNTAYGRASYEVSEIMQTYNKELAKILIDELPINEDRIEISDSLCELYLDKKGYEKISFHNHKYLTNIDGEFTYMIRDKDLNAVKGVIPNDATPKDASKIIINEFKNFIEK